MKMTAWLAGTALIPAAAFAQAGGGTAQGSAAPVAQSAGQSAGQGAGQSAGTPAATTSPAQNAAPTTANDILVVAESGPSTSIDRKSYVVRPGPAAEIATAVDVFRDLPSVSVDASGRVELLGNANVRILIDGRPVPDALSVLRSLNAAQIARVEVITNPSSQFSAEGTAGIINVITRRSSRDGLGGSVAGGLDSRGGGIARAAPTWTQGKWTLSTSPTLFRQRGETEGSLSRARLAGPADGITNREERSTGEQRAQGFAQRTQIVHRPDAKRSFSAALATSAVDVRSEGTNRVTPRGASFAPFEQRSNTDGRFRAANLVVDYRAEGDKPGELFTASLSGSRFNYDNQAVFRETVAGGGASSLLTADTRNRDKQATAKVDYATPLSPTRRLSIGGSVDWRRRDLFDRSVGASLLGLPRNQLSDFGGDYVEGAGYATLQLTVAGFKLLPGLRVQARRYSLDDLDGDGPSRIDPFPSMFVERKLSDRLTGVLSYSRRISWPDIGDLSPQLRYQGPTAAVRGNPDLDPEITDAFEARLSYGGRIHSFDLTLYDRITHDTFDRQIVLDPNGIVVSTPINAGRRVDQGLEAAFRGRLFPSLRYSLTGNLTAVTRNVGTIGNRRRDAQYRGKLQLDWTQGKAADPGFDQVTLNLRYEGPLQQFQYRREDFVDGDLSWTHRFTPRLSLVSSVQSLFGGVVTRSETRTPFILDRRRDEGVGRTARFTLTYQLSANPQSQPQPQAPAIPSVPMP